MNSDPINSSIFTVRSPAMRATEQVWKTQIPMIFQFLRQNYQIQSREDCLTRLGISPFEDPAVWPAGAKTFRTSEIMQILQAAVCFEVLLSDIVDQKRASQWIAKRNFEDSSRLQSSKMSRRELFHKLETMRGSKQTETKEEFFDSYQFTSDLCKMTGWSRTSGNGYDLCWNIWSSTFGWNQAPPIKTANDAISWIEFLRDFISSALSPRGSAYVQKWPPRPDLKKFMSGSPSVCALLKSRDNHQKQSISSRASKCINPCPDE